MKNRRFKEVMTILIFVLLLSSCNSNSSKSENATGGTVEKDTVTAYKKPLKSDIPTIGLLLYDGVLTTEVTATADVFTKSTEAGVQLFNVITIAETEYPVVSEEGITIVPDYSFENCPKLDVLFVPSAYDMYAQVHNDKIIAFIKEKDKETKYTVSNCAGAQLIGASGIADGKKIVTWIGGGATLQKEYPNLLVQNDSLVTYVEDGKYSSSNGNLASYISALQLLEKMTNTEHRKFVESYLYLDRLQNWKE